MFSKEGAPYLIAILRGITTEEAPAVVEALIAEGLTWIEVPLNSPNVFETLKLLQAEYGQRAQIGAGTVTRVSEVEKLAALGLSYFVTPNSNPAVISAAVDRNMAVACGCMTPSEAFAAAYAGAKAIKLFPCEVIGTAGAKAMRAVLPADVPLFAVGGIEPESLQSYIDAGCLGFGIGSALFKPGRPVEDIAARAKAFREAAERLS
ncbi:2-dehydro-3-deoxy-6-phosphogalactonate aldolase [Pelagibius sp. Alg239-R121]|uniref:2-dehydro-3-deoxy-6-phosphogalactonate aldolase n=1 Tax=Pelagibius sp. Alg239-R121 TaxID=2993448 RepID=UPI0024A76A6B|nr:2-dehydro-3-deoxy-6-phosphogalactonate aldolase [Pelagibius sp. Alg239-R121]